MLNLQIAVPVIFFYNELNYLNLWLVYLIEMIKPLPRHKIFEISQIADRDIAKRQSFYFQGFEGEAPAVIESIIPFYDHMTPLFNKSGQPPSFCVLAYDEILNGTSYQKGFAAAFVQLLKYLKIEELILVQDLCRSWEQFGFKTKDDRDMFQKIAGNDTGTTGFLLDHASLLEILPPLFHNNPDEGDCSFYTLSDDLQLSFLYWKGNLHTLFNEKDGDELSAAAKHAKLAMGGWEFAHDYYFGKKYEG